MSTPATSITTADQVGGGLGELTIRHSYEGGTTVVGTTTDSPAHHALGANPSWTWSRYTRAWLLRRSSRHRSPKHGDIALIEHALIEQALTALGYTVTREIAPAMPRRTAHHRSRRLGGQNRRVLRSRGCGVRRHSHNRRARGYNARHHSSEQSDRSAELSRRADVAADHMHARYRPVAVGNRIAKLEADRSRVQRWLDGEGALQVDGTASLPDHIIKTPPPGEHEYTNTTPWHEVRDHRTTEQKPPSFLTAYEEPGRERLRLRLADFESSTA